MKKTISIVPCAFAAALMLAGCGGGSGGSDNGSAVGQVPSGSTQAAAESPVDAAVSNFFSTDAYYTTSANDEQGNRYSLAYAIYSGAEGTHPEFGNTPMKRSLEAASISINGMEPFLTQSVHHFASAPYKLAGIANHDGELFRASEAGTLPQSAKVGASGLLAKGTVENNGSSYAQTIKWSLESDTASTAWLCTGIEGTDADGDAFAEKNCIRIDQAGAASGFKSDVSAPGISLQFR